MNLHRTGVKPQWETVTKSERNNWQRVAAATGGTITPGNAVSVAGLGMVTLGLKDILKGNTGRGVVLIGVGRIMDILDGFVADKTRTKSPLGEGLDVVIDKLEAAAALPVFYKASLAPKPIISAFVGQNLLNTAITAYAKHNEKTIHPSKEGKLNTGGQWGSIGLYGLSMVAENNGLEGVAEVLNATAFAATAATMYMGAKAVVGYTKDALSSRNTNIEDIKPLTETMPQLPQNGDSVL